MDRAAVLPLLVLLTILLAIIVSSVSADDVKHKRVIVKVPKKINHVHHHHVKKIHVYKHKPKAIHSIHVVEEDEPIGKEWKSLFHGQRIKHSRHKGLYGGGWKYDDADEEEFGYGGEDEDDEEEEEEYHKSGSQNEPTVWRGKKNGGKWSDYSGGRTKGRSGWRDERSKRHKQLVMHYRPDPSYRRPYSQKRPKKSSRNSKSKKNKKTRPIRPVVKGYSDYGEQSDDEQFNDSPIWPERKEHISWHLRQKTKPQLTVMPLMTESPHYAIEDYQSEHKGEINLVKPDIQEVQAPQLGPKLKNQEPKFLMHPLVQEQQLWAKDSIHQPISWAKEMGHGTDLWEPKLWAHDLVQKPQVWAKPVVEVPQMWPNPMVQEPNVWTKPAVQDQQWMKPATQEQDHRKPVVQVSKKTVTELLQTRKPTTVQDQNEVMPKKLKGFRTEVEHNGTGYSSHIGHSPEGDSASFQSVRFGDKIKTS